MEFLESRPDGGAVRDSRTNKLGVIVAGVIGSSAVILSAICLPFVTPALRKICLPYVPATNAQIDNVFRALQGRKGSLIDLGSGDGRIVFQAARNGFVAEGIELNPWLVIYSKMKAITSSSSASFSRKDIWKTDLGKQENIVIFGVECMMKDLEIKCQREMRPDAVVVACRFPFPELMPDKVVGKGIDKVWRYSKLSTR